MLHSDEIFGNGEYRKEEVRNRVIGFTSNHGSEVNQEVGDYGMKLRKETRIIYNHFWWFHS